jgi:RNA polymerase sigma factor (TIGR02999 family)
MPPATPGTADITSLLKAWRTGDRAALDQLTPLVYQRLRAQAAAYLKKEQAGHSLDATALVHEAWLRLVRAGEVDWQDRAHFFALAGRLMRRILVDGARARASGKRGGGLREQHSTPIDLDKIPASETDRADELCRLDEALTALSQIDPRRVQVIELRFFAGLSVDETAEVLGVSPQTVMRDWKLARAWLNRELRT